MKQKLLYCAMLLPILATPLTFAQEHEEHPEEHQEDQQGEQMDHSGHDMSGMGEMDHSGHDMSGTGEMDHSGHDMSGTGEMDHSGHDMSGMYGMDHSLHNAPNQPDHVMDHEVLLTKVTIDQLEAREHEGSALKGNLWFGSDFNKLWLKTEVEREDGETSNSELQALYSRAVAPYWDLKVGVRHDFILEYGDSKNWAAIGFNGLAPYFFEVDSTLFLGEDGDSALRLEAEYELLFTQQWILSPEIEMNFYGQNDRDTHTGSGLSDIEAGLRLRYEFTPQFAPYVGVHYEKKFGNTADFLRDAGESSGETTWVIGLHAWF
ncbi:copper resistance protein B [Microbulbifer pacificus]|uniref:Copper resistance protein B n=1 Tax=Microbulbifer pacificus TaxID=407164 RepID=A0AAU0N5P0_9GAMM|nr:copper resistance protein B [Microbulbifer pacificus]WOX06906.1 copper resistance protein B [Microbulbifer pacificus]